MKYLVCALVAASTLSAPALAQTAAGDVECFIVANAMVPQAKDAPSRSFAQTTAAFYLGRIVDLPPAVAGPAVKRASRTISGPDSVAILQACAKRAQAANAKFIAVASKVK